MQFNMAKKEKKTNIEIRHVSNNLNNDQCVTCHFPLYSYAIDGGFSKNIYTRCRNKHTERTSI